MPLRRYGTRVGAYRSRRRVVGKRRPGRRMPARRVRTRVSRPVTRRVLRRVLQPLQPEWKYYDIANDNVMNISTTITAPNAYAFCDGTGADKIWEGVNATQPLLLTFNNFLGLTASQRVGRKLQYKRIEIRYRIQPNATTTNPIRVRCFVMRTGDLPQAISFYGNTEFYGSSWPAISQDATACCWLYDNSNFDSFPSVLQGPRQNMLKVAAKRYHVVSPNYNTNSTAGTGYVMGNPSGQNHAFGRIVLRPKGPTWFNDEDTSFVNGYAQKGHYWLIFQADRGTSDLVIPASSLRVRCWYTDA